METLLDARRSDLHRRTREVLADLRDVLVEAGATEEDRTVLTASIRQLDDLFLLVVAGEFNSGKSAFINALLGHDALEEGVTPTTSQIYLLRYGEEEARRQLEPGVWEHAFRAPLLREIVIVDTPGTNAIQREHEALTTRFVPRSDLVLFVTSADRPFTESERRFLAEIRDWGKKTILVVNKIDILPADGDRREVMEFVERSADGLLGGVQALFGVSARLAREAKAGRPDVWQASGFGPLEDYIRQALDDEGRFRLKLQSPLGVAQRLLGGQMELADADLASLAADRSRLADIESQTGLFETDMRRGFEARLAQIDNILLEMQQRGDDFFDQTIRFARIADLLRTRATGAAFQSDVVADVPLRIDAHVTELIDWLVAQDLRQWTAVADHLARGADARTERIVGHDPERQGTLAYDRHHLVESLRRSSRIAVDGYDERAEAARMAEAARAAVVDTGLAGVGVGIGVAIAAAAHVVWLDVTGIVAGVLAAVFGLFILPSRRSRAKAELRTRLDRLRRDLVAGLSEAFDREMLRNARRIDDTVAPFARFVRAETERIGTRRERLTRIDAEILQLHGELDRPTATGG